MSLIHYHLTNLDVDIKYPFPCLTADTLLGHGANCYVHRITDLVVLKVQSDHIPGPDGTVPRHLRNEDAGEQIVKEQEWFSIFNAAPHPNILQSFMSTPEGTFLPRMRTDLKQTIFTAKLEKQPIEMRLCYRWTKELAAAAAYLESIKLAHCDIKPLNVFIDQNDHVKLGDFDTMTRYGEYPEMSVAPPWIWHEESCSRKQDLFGIGDTLWELFTGNEYQWGVPEEPEFIPDTSDVELGDIISRCWHTTYPSISDLAKETESRYLRLVYGVYAPIIQLAPILSRLAGDWPARILSEKEVAHGRAVSEKFLVDQTS
ncbi:MAG: hypothetical protein Q9222_005366 [Ikaeria aurantiellina]